MRRNSFLTFLKEKSFIIVLALMLVSAGTMAALFSLGGNDPAEEHQVAQQEESIPETVQKETTDTKEKEEKAPASLETASVNKAKSVRGNGITPKQSETANSNADNAVISAELEDQYLEASEMAEVSTDDIVAEGFQEAPALNLQWPVNGEVILEFAMDHSIYFPTLAQYQYNPAMIISAAEGTEVLCAAAGTVIDTGKTNEYGHYVTMDLGNGYELTYGQLFDITTEVGEVLEAGDRMALVAYPTRNYTEEGENLYLKLTLNGVAVDPKFYLE